MIDSALIESYKAAKYIVDINNKPCRIFVDQGNNSVIDSLLNKHKKACAYFITPENPFSHPLRADENKLRHHRFATILKEKNDDYYLEYGTDEVGIWPKEISYLILSDDHDAMHKLASQFGQNGILKLRKKSNVKLQILASQTYADV